MNKVATILLAALLLTCAQLRAQLYLTLKKMPAENVWGVYVHTCDSLSPTNQTITGSGQVTIVAKMGSVFSELTNMGGAWDDNALVYSPVENPGMLYFTMGFVADQPAITYLPGEETLLFTFKMTNQDGSPPALIDNETDPFAQLPNSIGTNPGNELSVVDFGKSPLAFYNYSGIYHDGDTADCEEGNTPTAVEASLPDSQILLYPNPAANRIILKATKNSSSPGYTARLWNADMVQMGSIDFSGRQNTEIDIENLPPGMYLITIEEQGHLVRTERFLKMDHR